ncbi:hypothetical protein [Desulfovibrio sp. 3_1_syn3]|uniref:hypothetical protein n=1 Tax=Desulfovibrio sp. 3_1_syn3 TaxID=457398 RepID=UPI0011C6FE4E|nr:hypothetical protein [Desulfovibrio sp. 3_1_syn3]
MPIANESFVASFIFPHPLLENMTVNCLVPLLWKISRKDGSLGYSLSAATKRRVGISGIAALQEMLEPDWLLHDIPSSGKRRQLARPSVPECDLLPAQKRTYSDSLHPRCAISIFIFPYYGERLQEIYMYYRNKNNLH